MSEYGICLEPNCHDDEPKELPSFKDMAKGFIESAKDVMSGAIQGDGVLVTEEVYNNRIDICNSCEFFRNQDKRCSQCGCFMEIKAKFKKTYCPIHKWND